MGDIGAPEHAPRSERVEHAMQRVVDAVEWVRIQSIARLAGRFTATFLCLASANNCGRFR